jgi:hypothetical protein
MNEKFNENWQSQTISKRTFNTTISVGTKCLLFVCFSS